MQPNNVRWISPLEWFEKYRVYIVILCSLSAWPWICYGYSSLLEGIGDVFDVVVYPDVQLKQVNGYGTTPLLATRLTLRI